MHNYVDKKAIKIAMVQVDLNQGQLAKLVNTSGATLSDVLHGKVKPSLDVYLALQKFIADPEQFIKDNKNAEVAA